MDIVERLRYAPKYPDGHWPTVGDCRDAADEIERLRRELQKSKDATASVLRDLAAERGRIASSSYHQRMVENAHRRGVVETVQRLNAYLMGGSDADSSADEAR